jgi:hypothetical protein
VEENTMGKLSTELTEWLDIFCESSVGAREITEVSARKDISKADKARAKKEYGDVTFADEKNKKYPIDTQDHVRAAISYFGMGKNTAKYPEEDRKAIAGKIARAAKKFGINLSDDWKKSHGLK